MLERNFNNQESKSSRPTRGKSNLKFKEQPETLMPEEKKRSKSAIRPQPKKSILKKKEMEPVAAP